jgi:hypothetical protein
MLETFKALTQNQFDAALCTLNACIDRCPEPAWHAPVGSLAFCQVVFHALFFADLYLGRDEASLRGQPFHAANESFFRDYEELEPRAQQNHYDRAPVKAYLDHCRGKVATILADETEATLAGPSGFGWCRFTRAELHVYNFRHVQHHAAQLSLRLRVDHRVEIPWVGSGWRELPPQ